MKIFQRSHKLFILSNFLKNYWNKTTWHNYFQFYRKKLHKQITKGIFVFQAVNTCYKYDIHKNAFYNPKKNSMREHINKWKYFFYNKNKTHLIQRYYFTYIFISSFKVYMSTFSYACKPFISYMTGMEAAWRKYLLTHSYHSASYINLNINFVYCLTFRATL